MGIVSRIALATFIFSSIAIYTQYADETVALMLVVSAVLFVLLGLQEENA